MVLKRARQNVELRMETHKVFPLSLKRFAGLLEIKISYSLSSQSFWSVHAAFCHAVR